MGPPAEDATFHLTAADGNGHATRAGFVYHGYMSDRPTTADDKLPCRNLGWLFDAAHDRGIDTESLLEGVAFSEEHIRDRGRFVDWATLERICANFGRTLTDDEVVVCGRESVEHPVFRVFAAPGRLLFDTVDAYRFLCGAPRGLVPRSYPQVVVSFEEIESGEIRIGLEAREGFSPIRVWEQMLLGQLIALPTVLGSPAATVERTETARGATFRVHYAVGRAAPLAFLRRALRWPFVASSVARELMATNELLEEKNRSLEEEVERRQHAEAALAEREARYRFLAERARDVIWTADLDLRLTYISPSAEEVFGFPWSKQETLQPGVGITEESIERLRRLLTDELARDDRALPDRPIAIDGELLTGSGVRRSVEVNMCFTRDGEGRPTGLLGVTRDVTERRQAAEQLRLAQKTESIGHLAGGVAHDFNNLLVAIQGYTELAQKSADVPGKVRGYLDEVGRAADRAKSLTQQLLAYGRKQRIEVVAVDLTGLVHGLRPMLERLIPERIEQRFDLQPGAIVMADPQQVEQVVVNLAVNARDAMSDGGTMRFEVGTVLIDEPTASLHRDAKAGAYVRLRVADTGSGMSSDVEAQIFDPFFTTKAAGAGSGLGLSVALGVVSQHGGFVALETEVGRGTTFSVHLPLAEGRAAGRSTQAPADPILLGGDETILLVEDEDIVRTISLQFLEDAGYTVHGAVDGTEALEEFVRHGRDIDLVLMDVVMPKMGGPEARERILAIAPETPVLLVSGYAGGVDQRELALVADSELLSKPYTRGELLGRVRALLDRRPFAE